MYQKYREAAVEVLEILEHTPIEKVNLIPKKFINYLKENASKDYKVQFDYTKPINEMNIKNETKGILGTISRNWWWNQAEKQEYASLIKEKEIKIQKELREKYNPDDIFKNRERMTLSDNKTEVDIDSMIKYKENIVIKLIKKIKSFFHKNSKI